ncbi:MAG: hypothetical protein RMY62_005830 [Nostoc sp. ZfuVER08]|nr:hypothetical protein [Nostoc sp. ZfuVER08]
MGRLVLSGAEVWGDGGDGEMGGWGRWGDGGMGEMGRWGDGAEENNNSQINSQQSSVISQQSTVNTHPVNNA